MPENPQLLLEELKASSDQILTTLSEIIGINTFFVAVNDSTKNFILKAFNREEVLVKEGTLPFYETYCSLVAREEDDILIIPNTEASNLTRDMKVTDEIGNTAFVGVPIQLRDGTKIGTICGMDRNSYQFSKTEISLLKSMASFLSYVIELENIAFKDNLTQVFNRNYIEMYFTDGWQDKHKTIAFLFFDFDDFKGINDRYDHSVGDKVLKTVATKINEALRPGDLLCRSGGDEFLAMIFDYEEDDVLLQTIEKVQKALSEPVLLAAGEIPVSTSIGVSCYPKDGTEIHDLVKKADLAMYQVKQNGKNHYGFHPSNSPKMIKS